MEKPPEIVSCRCIITDNDNILLLQRTKDDLFNAGKWEIPGGKIDPGQSAEDSQIREIKEETGLDIEPDNSDTYIDSFIITDGRYSGSKYISIVGLAKVIKGNVKLSPEHDDFNWVPSQEIPEYDLTDISTTALKHFKYLL